MGSRYVPITRDEMEDMIVKEMGFHEVPLEGTFERVYERQIVVHGKEIPFKIRVYSTIDFNTDRSRDCAADAIRVGLVNTETGRYMKKEHRTHRTMNALTNMRERARDIWKFAAHHLTEGCPKCDSSMAVRKGRNGLFLGCTQYPKCNGTRQIKED